MRFKNTINNQKYGLTQKPKNFFNFQKLSYFRALLNFLEKINGLKKPIQIY